MVILKLIFVVVVVLLYFKCDFLCHLLMMIHHRGLTGCIMV